MKDNKKFHRIYDDLIDLHTRKILLHVDPSDMCICADPEYTERLDAETAKELFIKGMMIGCVSDSYILPVGMDVEEDTGAVIVYGITTTATTSDGSTTYSPTSIVFYSKEHFESEQGE